MLMMHLFTLSNITLLNGSWNGIVMAVNTFLLVLAFGLVLATNQKGSK